MQSTKLKVKILRMVISFKSNEFISCYYLFSLTFFQEGAAEKRRKNPENIQNGKNK
jgi:hypothetical protein